MALVSFPEDSTEGFTRIVTMTAESVINDLLLCIESSARKRKKRIKRVLFLWKFFHDEISMKTKIRMAKIIKSMHIDTIVDTSNADSLEQLLKEVDSHSIVGDLVFEKKDPTAPREDPHKRVFDDKCKEILNNDGFVYDIVSAIVVLAYHELVTQTSSSYLRLALMRASKLIFKGGASIGKFLFMMNKPLWKSMTDADKQTVINDFVNGGDNDTCIKFERNAETAAFSDVDINNMIATLTYDMQINVMELVNRYNVDNILDVKLSSVEGQTMQYDGVEITLKQRSTKSFFIAEKNKQHVELMVADETKEARLFGTVSFVEFQTKNGMTKFYLARLKAAFNASMGDVHSDVGCYGECLDISFPCIDSVDEHAEYQNIGMYELMEELLV